MFEQNTEDFEYGDFLYGKDEDSTDGLCCNLKFSQKAFGKNVVIPREVFDKEGKRYKVTGIFPVFFEESSIKNIESLYVPNTIKELYWNFYVSKNLRAIYVDSESPIYCDDAGVVYSKDKRSLVVYPPAYPVEEYRVLPSTEEICNLAFKMARKLKVLHVPASVHTIGLNAFYGCSSLEYVYIDGKIKKMGPNTTEGYLPRKAKFHYQGKEWTFEELKKNVTQIKRN